MHANSVLSQHYDVGCSTSIVILSHSKAPSTLFHSKPAMIRCHLVTTHITGGKPSETKKVFLGPDRGFADATMLMTDLDCLDSM